MISLIAAMDSKKGIGKDGKIPWHIAEDFKHFKSLTMGHPIIMGRKTFEAIGKALPGRTNIVITHNLDLARRQIEGIILVGSVEEAMEKAKTAPGSEEIFVIGGGQIYTQVMGIADKLYLTIIKGDFKADTFFPEYQNFKKVSEESHESEGLKYKFLELEK